MRPSFPAQRVSARQSLALAVLGCLLGGWRGSAGGAAPGRAADDPPASLPNIVLIFADDLGYGDLGCFGSTKNRTPRIDQLAEQGTRFTDFYVSQAVCTASRASLLTGCYANRVGLEGALNHSSPAGIHPAEELLPEMLKAKGYATGIFGKWHLGLSPWFSPLENGFDEYLGIPYSNDNSKYHPTLADVMPPLPLYDGAEVIETDPDQTQFTRRLTERAVDFINRQRGGPFFLYLPHVMPHVPIFASDAFRGRSANGLYGDVIEELDWSVGRIVDAIDAAGLKDTTAIIFLSDNGPFLSYGAHAGDAGPLREGKLTAFEGGVRTPCLIRWPGTVPAGRVCREPLMTIDFWPTFAAWVGAPLPAEPIDGQDITAVLEGEPDDGLRERPLWFYAGAELHAVRSGRWKLHLPHPYLTTINDELRADGKPAGYGTLAPKSISQSGLEGIASRHGYRVARQPQALYDLEADPGETTDVSGDHPAVVERLLVMAEEARAELGDSLSGAVGRANRPAGRSDPPGPAGR
jgi:arylsulfatase A-like enzyme